MSKVSLRDRFRVRPIRRIVAAMLAFGLAPVAIYVDARTNDITSLAIAIGLLLLALSFTLRPVGFVWPFTAELADRLEREEQVAGRGMIGSLPLYKMLQTVGIVVAGAGAIANVLTRS